MFSRKMMIVLCITLSVMQGVLGQVWEFGVDALGSLMIDHKEGTFSLFQKNKEIMLETPQCYVIEYVRVEVKNSVSTPKVLFNKHTNSVAISYKPLQYSVSSYNIIAKAARMPGCFNPTVEWKMRHTYGKK